MTPDQIRNLVGKACRFDYQGKRLSGIIDKAEPKENAQPGNIPDASLAIRGASGKVLTGISLVNAYVDLIEENP